MQGLITQCVWALPVFFVLSAHVSANEVNVLAGVTPVTKDQLLKLERRVHESFSKCFQVGGAICLGESVLAPHATERGLVAHWNFDKLHPIDESGNGNHIITPVRAGPPSNGHGSSAIFDEETSCRVLASPSLEFREFTLNLRLYLLDGYSSDFRAIISRLSYDRQGPTVLLHPRNNKLSVRVSTTYSSTEGITSNSDIPPRRWTQITVIASKKTLKLYINGMLDSAIALGGEIVVNSGDMFIGKSMNLQGFKGFLDDVKLYNYAINPKLVPSLASPSLTGFDSAFRVQLASTHCTLKEATSKGLCAIGCKLCTLDQLYRNAAHVARANGWMHRSNQIWHTGIYNTTQSDKRVALCCC
ncbi:ookinete protein [Babesia gibsoni]|uniref:Ookinete protein n=1 Tax=Babesia gibsoni TaxID=33632 RepID=A0AAD8LR88_BABGI|nr:ookinete protein [Babesia gibsoni]